MADQLLERLRAGDEDAFREVVRRHQASMIAVAMGFVRSRAAAEEVVQETWLALIDGGLDRFEGRASLKNWIFSILTNKARTRAVRDGRSVSLDRFANDGHDDEDAVDPARFDAAGRWRVGPALIENITPERVVAGRRLWEHVQEEMQRLPAGQQSVLAMRDVQGMAAGEVAERLGISAENQRVLLHRARARIRQFLEDLAGE